MVHRHEGLEVGSCQKGAYLHFSGSVKGNQRPVPGSVPGNPLQINPKCKERAEDRRWWLMDVDFDSLSE